MVDAPEGKTISQLLESGDIDAFIAPRVPRLAGKNNPNIGWLFRDPIAAGKDYFKRTGIFPIMHVTGIRRTLVEQHPVAAGGRVQGVRAVEGEMPGGAGGHRHQQMHAAVSSTSSLRAARELMGHDFWSLRPSRPTARCWRRSCGTTIRKACRHGW